MHKVIIIATTALVAALALASSALSINPVKFVGVYRLHSRASGQVVCTDPSPNATDPGPTTTPVPARSSPYFRLNVLGGYVLTSATTRARIVSHTNSVMGVAQWTTRVARTNANGGTFVDVTSYRPDFSYFHNSERVNVSGTFSEKSTTQQVDAMSGPIPGAYCVQTLRGVLSGTRVRR
jgi:hypothetical protein